ncbi:hypothetical protein GCM10009535_28040 [Streptomyces thermocarboxydovorans]|uniref:Uncharacterized protein n=1 Tax=Streptomyces thermocarboxydovorans TaxID=59298 RepID=A0ABN1HH41_9ACTN
MAGVPGHRLALLGGGFSTDDDGLLDDWVLSQVPSPRPKVCFVPTASGDAPAYVEQFLSAYRTRSVQERDQQCRLLGAAPQSEWPA